MTASSKIVVSVDDMNNASRPAGEYVRLVRGGHKTTVTVCEIDIDGVVDVAITEFSHRTMDGTPDEILALAVAFANDEAKGLGVSLDCH